MANSVVKDDNCCSICLSDYTSPRILPCQHIYCEACLRDYVDKSQEDNVFKCPNCRKEVQLINGDVSDFPQYSIKEEEEEEEEEEKEEEEETATCGVCEKLIEASFLCFECDKKMCDACKASHDLFLKSHTIQNLCGDVTEKPYCKNHDDVIPEFYCKQCDSLLCKECGSTHGLPCFTILIKLGTYLEDTRQMFEEYVEKVEEKLEADESARKTFLSETEKNIDTKINEITQLGPDIIRDFENACTEVKKNKVKDKSCINKLKVCISRIKKILKNQNFSNIKDFLVHVEDVVSIKDTHQSSILPNNVNDIINKQLCQLDISYQFTKKAGANMCFVGGIHWTISSSSKNYNSDTKQTTIILYAFCKENDKSLVESVNANVTFCIECSCRNHYTNFDTITTAFGNSDTTTSDFAKPYSSQAYKSVDENYDCTLSRTFTKTFTSANNELSWEINHLGSYKTTYVKFKIISVKYKKLEPETLEHIPTQSTPYTKYTTTENCEPW